MPAANPTDGDSSLIDWMDRQCRLSTAAMLQSISAVHLVKERPGFGQTIRPIRGSVLASPMIAAYDPDPDYFFHWLRDSAIVIDALRTLIEEGDLGQKAVGHISDFVRFSLALGDLDGRELLTNGAAKTATDPNFQQYLRPPSELSEVFGDGVFAETRFNPDGSIDVTKWARPQHDGPALRALVLMRCWRLGLFENPDDDAGMAGLIRADLAFTLRHWQAPSFDIWEEELGDHYYTGLAQHAALADGALWMDERGDRQGAEACRGAALEIVDRLDSFWSDDAGFYRSRLGVAAGSPEKELDIAVILAVIHARRESGPHSVADPKVHATLARLERLFLEGYPINHSAPPGHGAAMGRYAGDRYYSGGAYYFATLGVAEFFYRAAASAAAGRQMEGASLVEQGDRFMATVRAYTPASGELSEQFDRVTGRQTSSKNLTWSHAALITAVSARRTAARARDPTT
jgi:glucoamylase